MDDVNIGAFLSLFLHPPRVLLQPLHNQFLVDFLLISIGEQRNLFVREETIDISARSFPLLYALCFQHYPFLAIGNEDLLSKFSFFHVLEESHIADGCVQGGNVQSPFTPSLHII